MEEVVITSKDNSKIKFLRQLRQKKYRDESARFFVENMTIIYDALRSGAVFESLFATKEFIAKNQEKFRFLLDRAKLAEYYLIDEKINKSFSELETPPGICAIYRKEKKEISFKEPIVYLNGINDPGNLGTILRSALAFSLKNIVIDEHSADVYNFKTVNAAKDSIFKLNIGFDKDLGVFYAIKKAMPVFSTHLGKAEGIEVLGRHKLYCVVLGSESHGVDNRIQNFSDGFIRIDMSSEIESLNVASAAAILFYEIYKQRRQAQPA